MGKENTFVVTDLHSRVTQKTHSFGLEWEVDLMQPNREADMVLFVLHSRKSSATDSSNKMKLAIYYASEDRLESIAVIMAESSSIEIHDAALSESGDVAAISGKKEKGWLAVYRVRERKLLWEKEFPDSKLLEQIEISSDGSNFYAGWIDRKVMAFDISGEVINEWSMRETRKSQQERMRLAALKISADDRYLIAGKEVPGEVWVWDIIDGKFVGKFESGNVHISSIAVSPECDKTVSAGFNVTDKTRVWKLVK
jgi:WD40 repeat protein